MNDLALAQARRVETAINLAIDEFVDSSLDGAKLSDAVSKSAKIKLRGVLRKYSKSLTPFQDFVSDNLARFGPGRTEAVAAAITSSIKGANWKSKTAGTALSDEEKAYVVDGDVLIALDAVSSTDLKGIFLSARAFDEFGTTETATLVDADGAAELTKWGSR